VPKVPLGRRVLPESPDLQDQPDQQDQQDRLARLARKDQKAIPANPNSCGMTCRSKYCFDAGTPKRCPCSKCFS
jgi:hypothetical protein